MTEHERLQNIAHILACLALQSDRYTREPDFRDAVDGVLALTTKLHINPTQTRSGAAVVKGE